MNVSRSHQFSLKEISNHLHLEAIKCVPQGCFGEQTREGQGQESTCLCTHHCVDISGLVSRSAGGWVGRQHPDLLKMLPTHWALQEKDQPQPFPLLHSVGRRSPLPGPRSDCRTHSLKGCGNHLYPHSSHCLSSEI